MSIIWIVLLWGQAHSQNPDLPSERCTIVLKSDKTIKDARLWEIYPDRIEYEKGGSLHDLLIDEIKRIETSKELIAFDKGHKLLYMKKDLMEAIPENSKQEEKNIQPSPPLAGQNTTSLIILSDKVGEEIDRNERDHYRLFPGIKGFISARCFTKASPPKSPQGGDFAIANANYDIKIKYGVGGQIKDTIMPINEYGKYYLQKYLLVYEEKINKNENVDCPICDYLIQRGLVANLNEQIEPIAKTVEQTSNKLVVKGHAPSLQASGTGEKRIYHNTYLPDGQLYYLGKSDGYKYYEPKEEVMLGTCASTGCFPLFGLLTLAGIAATVPKNIYDRAPNKELLKDQQYLKGYQRGAHNKKVARATTGCLGGAGFFIIGVIAYSFLYLY